MHFISVVILSFLSALAAAEPDVKMVDFTVNCKTWKIASHTLEATCPDWDGNYKDSSLDLNQCYTYNQDFQLEFKVGCVYSFRLGLITKGKKSSLTNLR